MDKAEILAAIWMSKHDMSHNMTMDDYIKQFDELVKQFQSQMDALKND